MINWRFSCRFHDDSFMDCGGLRIPTFLSTRMGIGDGLGQTDHRKEES